MQYLSVTTSLGLAAFWLTGPAAFAGSFTSNFTDPSQPGLTLNAQGTLPDGVTSWQPVIGNGVLMLTTNVNNVVGSAVLDDLDGGQPIESFTAKFKLQLGPGSGNPADGFYFGFSPDITSTSSFFEEGPALTDGGLGVEFDDYDNGITVPDTIGIDVMAGSSVGPYGGQGNNEIAIHPLPKSSMVTSSFKDVVIQLNRNGTLNVTYGNQVIYTNQYMYGWFPVQGQFALDARTGGENQVCLISNLTVTTTLAGPLVPASITAQPQNVSVNEGETATIGIGFDGTAPFNFEWSKNGTPVPFGTNNPVTTADVNAAQQNGQTLQAYGPFNVLTITNASPADNNASFTVKVSNTNSDGTLNSVTSNPAVLTVKADLTAPTIVSTTVSNDFQHVTLVFSKPITEETAQAVANYAIDQGLSVSSATLSTNDNKTVILTTSPQSYNTTYSITLNNIKDRSFTGNSIAANSKVTFTSPVLTITGAGALQSTNGVTSDVGINFSLPVDPATATNASNYQLSAGAISNVVYLAGSPGVVLQASGLTAGSNYTVAVSNVANLVGNKIASTNVSFSVSKMKWGVVGADQLNLGNAVLAVGTNGFDVYSDGISEWNNYDEATFVYEQITGDFDKKVRVEYQDLSSQWARAGLIARDVTNFGVDAATQTGDPSGTSSNSGTPPFTGTAARYQKVHVNPVGPTLTGPGNPGNALWEGNRRLDTGGPSSTALTGANSTPQYPNAWCRLQRTGQTFTIYRSDDGTNWVNLGSTTWPDSANPDSTPMPDTLYVGPDFSPENGNITDEASHGVFVAKFREYGDTSGQPSGGSPSLSVTRSSNGLSIAFTGTLQSADAITGPWTDMTGPSPQTVTTSGTTKFYRARQ